MRGSDLASGKWSGMYVIGMAGKIARPISPAVIRPLGPIPMSPLRVISDEDTSPETEGESCDDFRVFWHKTGPHYHAECKQSPYRIKISELSATKSIIKGFSK